MTNKQEYLQGYQDALQGIDEFITYQIKRNGGATTLLQVLNVFNATLAHIHSDLAETRYEVEHLDEKTMTVEEVINTTIEEVINTIFTQAIKGGK